MKKKPLHGVGLVMVTLWLWPGELAGQIRMNEIMASNGGAVTAPGGGSPDYIELFNGGALAVDLSGWKIVDSTSATSSKAYAMPGGTVISAGGYLMLWLDAQTNGPGPGLHATSFSLSAAGEVVSLFNASAAVMDRVSFGVQVTGKPLCRLPNGTGAWVLGNPTPGGPNTAVLLGTPLALRLNEWLPTNSLGADRLEIYNPATNGPVALGGASGVLFTGSLTFPDTNSPLVFSNSFIDAGGFVRFECDNVNPGSGDPADHLGFRLSSSAGETISLFMADRTTLIDRISFGTFTNLPALGRNISMGRFPDGSTNIVFFQTNHTTLGSANVRAEKVPDIIVNEVLSHTDPPFEDALELFNPLDATVDIGEWWISNSQNNPFKYRVPQNTIVPAHGYKVLYEQSIMNGPATGSGFNPSGTDNAPDFTFNSAHGDNVVITFFGPSPLLNGSNIVYQSVRDFPAAENAVSYGVYVKSDGGTDFVPMSTRSFGVDNPGTVMQFRTGTGLPNPYPRVGPLVISEIMYHPPDVGTNDNVLDEYVELTSITNGVLPLFDPAYPTNTWSLAGGINFTFPMNVSVPAHGSLLVVNFNPQTNSAQLAAFRSVYNLPPTVPVFGPYGGKLINSSETIFLYKPDAVQLPPKLDAGYVPQIFVEKVKYEDMAPWPTNADGGGVTLQRLSLKGYANDHTNWVAAAPTPGQSTSPAPEPVQVFALETTPAGAFILDVATVPGREYVVEGSTNLAAGSWIVITTFTASSNKTTVTNHLTVPQFPWRFYRARTL